MAHILQFGAGLVGKTIALDLAQHHIVTVVDLSASHLTPLKGRPNIRTIQEDATKITSLKPLIKDADILIGALPGFLGYQANKALIPFGKPIVDISFFPEDPWDLDPLAKEYNVTLAMDCGLAPGMSNLFCGYFAGRMDVKQFRCLVGGLPQHPTGPLKYKAVFSPIDVIEEYTRPARIVMDGEIQTVAALSDLEGITMAGMDLEAFNTDGLRTLLKTVNIENMVEKTIRYRGTTQYLTMLTDLGFFATSVLRVKDQLVRPIDVTAELLIPEWKMTDEDRDITLMQIMIRGEKNHAPYEIQYELIDRFDTEAGISSMARTTGFTATAVTNYILNGQWDKPGLCPMELLGRDENAFHFILDYLAQRGVNYRQI